MDLFKSAKVKESTNQIDKNFTPIARWNQLFLNEVKKTKRKVRVQIAIERNLNIISTYQTYVFHHLEKHDDLNFLYIERLIKSLLWLKGGYKIYFAGPKVLFNQIKDAYQVDGIRAFDQKFMEKIYEQPFEILHLSHKNMPKSNEKSIPLGRNLNGYRIGFDAGGSDRKVSAVIHGNPVYSEEVVWHPKLQEDPNYHYQGIIDSIEKAKSQMEKLDAIGVSSAGVYIDNKVMAASLFMKVPEALFQTKIKNMFIDIGKKYDVPIVVANDGDVTALAGSMSLKSNQVLGIAMGTSEAAGYIDQYGNITGWLNELAFVPIDIYPKSMKDEWSGDYGCGVKYLSQDAVIKLAKTANIQLEPSLSPAEKLKFVQNLAQINDTRALSIFDTIGCYLGYAIAHYATFYEIKHVLILGRVTSGIGGVRILNQANLILKHHDKKLHQKIKISLPDEKNRRVGQSIAAASLPQIL
jgi:predicted NBD/HSP70 family sugar kinase